MQYHIVKAFSKNGAGGNPAAIVINSAADSAQRQAIARQIGFSETGFVNTDQGKLQIEFFTPERPIPYCGHATIGAINILKQQGLVENGKHILTTKAEPITVEVQDQQAFMQQAFPTFKSVTEKDGAQLLQLGRKQVKDPVIARNGVGFLLLEVEDDDTLFNIEPDLPLIRLYSEINDLVGVYVYVNKGTETRTRMFAPYYGIDEENATGMAAGLLGGRLYTKSAGLQKKLRIEQGHSPIMKEQGWIDVIVNDENEDIYVLVGGEATVKESAELPA